MLLRNIILVNYDSLNFNMKRKKKWRENKCKCLISLKRQESFFSKNFFPGVCITVNLYFHRVRKK